MNFERTAAVCRAVAVMFWPGTGRVLIAVPTSHSTLHNPGGVLLHTWAAGIGCGSWLQTRAASRYRAEIYRRPPYGGNCPGIRKVEKGTAGNAV